MSDHDRGRYRRIYSTEFHEATFQVLTDSERVVWFYAKTGPQSTSVGIYRMSTAVAIEDLGNNLTPEDFDQHFGRVCEVFSWRFNEALRVLWIPEWLEDNPPQSPNVVSNWRKLLNQVPDCDVKAEAVTAIQQYLKNLLVPKPEAYREAFGRYTVSLPKDPVNSQAQPKPQPKAKPQADQGSGIQGFRDPGVREQTALRAGAVENQKKTNDVPIHDAKLLEVASEVIRDAPRNASREYLTDAFLSLSRHRSLLVTKQIAQAVLAQSQQAATG